MLIQHTQGSFRCDVNISVGKIDSAPNTRVEVKNLNSIKFIGQAIGESDKKLVSKLWLCADDSLCKTTKSTGTSDCWKKEKKLSRKLEDSQNRHKRGHTYFAKRATRVLMGKFNG